MTDCSNYGDALVGREDDEPRWIRSPEDVHVSTELLDDPEAVAFIETRYRIGEPCPITPDTVHAHRIDQNTPVSTPSGPSAGLEGQDATQEMQDATEAAQRRVERFACTCPVPSATIHFCSEQPQGFTWVEVAAASRLAEQATVRRAEAAEARVAELEAIVAKVREGAREIAERAVKLSTSLSEWRTGGFERQAQRIDAAEAVLREALHAPKDTTAP